MKIWINFSNYIFIKHKVVYLWLYQTNSMKYIKGFFVLIWRIWMILLATIYVLTIGIFIVLPLANFDKTFPYIYPFIRYWGKFVLYGTGFRIDYEKLVPLDPKENYIFIANHTSVMDIMLVLTLRHTLMAIM